MQVMVCLAACSGVLQENKPLQCLFHLLLLALNKIQHTYLSTVQGTVGRGKAATFSGKCMIQMTSNEWLNIITACYVLTH
jgi:hypothetical protein